MTTWIKICGLTTKDGVDAAIAAGVDAVGFVFATSKRQVTAIQARALAEAVPKTILRVAVMLHPLQSLVDEVCAVFKPDILQTDYHDLKDLQLPSGLQVLPVIRSGQDMPTTLPARFLYEGPTSGTGQPADWRRASELARQAQLILAGGLNADNVSDAIVRIRPFGVDVSSGVEGAPGIKDVRKIEEFVRAVRATNQFVTRSV